MAPKKKQEKMSIGTFLSDQKFGDWADEMEDMPLPPTNRDRPSYGGSSMGRDFSSFSRMDPADRGPPREQLPLPTRPPYTAHLGNLSFEVMMGDVEDYFTGCEVTNVRIVEDKIEHKPKGFGYVEFGSLDGLKKALTMNGTQFQGRNIRVSVAEPPKEREGMREISDWSRKGPLPDLPNQMGPRRPSGRGFEAAGSDAGSDRGAPFERGGSRRGGPAFEGDGKPRDFGNWERKGPLSPVPQSAGPERGGDIRRNDRSFDRRPSPAWGEGTGKPGPGSDQGSRPPRRDISERPAPAAREPTAADMDSAWRNKMQPDKPPPSATPTPDASTPSSPVATNVRPRLNLAKRTVSQTPQEQTGSANPDGESKASPFGAARPIDTHKRDQEIEDRRAAERKQKEEDDAKAKTEREKLAAEKAARGEAAGSASKAATEGAATGAVSGGGGRGMSNGRSASASASNSKDAKENGAFQPKADFKILQREGENGEEQAVDPEEEEEAENPEVAEAAGSLGNGDANGAIVGAEEKDVKPGTVVRDPSAGEQDASTAQAEQDEGWNVVPGKQPRVPSGRNGSMRGRGGGGRGRGRGNAERGESRALAS